LVAAVNAVTLGAGAAVAQGVVPTDVYTIAAASAPSPAAIAEHDTAGTSSNYIISFATATALTGGVDTVTLTDPSGSTTFPGSTADYLVVDNSSSSSGLEAVSSAHLADGGSGVTLGLTSSAATGDSLTVYVIGATNPTNAGSYSLDVSTSENPAAATTPGYQIASATASDPATVTTGRATIDLSSPTPLATAVYAVHGLVSNAPLTGGSSTLELSAPPGTIFPGAAEDYEIIDMSKGQTAVPAGAVSGGGSDQVILTLGRNVASGDLIDIVASGVVNPGAGNYSLSVLGDIEAATSSSAASASTPSAGYWLATKTGTVYGVGGATSFGDATTSASTGPVVGIAGTSDGKGYWVVTADGSVRAFGDAPSFGDLPAENVKTSDIVAIAPTADGRGYWLVGKDGGVFTFGDAKYHNSVPALGLHVTDVVGMAPAPGGGGYLMVGSDGGVFSFGSATFHGSLPGLGVRVDDIRAILPSSTGSGYVLVGQDGGAFVLGSGARFVGSLPGKGVAVHDIVGIALTAHGNGYYMAGANGAVYSFGDAPSLRAPTGLATNLPVTAIAGT
jgi:hypothetical protein